MSTVALTTERFVETLKRPGILLIDWWAAWCGPCRAFAPVYEAASERHPDVTFAKIDTEAEPALSAAFEIRSIPTLMAFRDGVLLFAQAGMLPAAALDDLIRQVRSVDMVAIQRELAARDENRPQPSR